MIYADPWLPLFVMITVVPWHARGRLAFLRYWRSKWPPSFIGRILLIAIIINTVNAFLHRDWIGFWDEMGYALAYGYDLYRAWRDKNPPKHRFKKTATAALKKLADRIKAAAPRPIRIPIPAPIGA